MPYVLEPAEWVTHEVRRVARDCIDESLDILNDLDRDPVDVEKAVHTVRKRCKEVRAVARLVRSSLGDEFQHFNQLVGDAAEALAPIRDAHAVLSTFDELRSTNEHDAELDEVRAAQAEVAAVATDSVRGGDLRIALARRLLKAARKLIKHWRIEGRFATIRSGIERTYRAGGRDLRRARNKPTDDRLHEWRKSVKTLWYQLRLVQRAAPSMLQPLIASLDDLAEALGDDHDLAVLIGRLEASPDRFGGKRQAKRAVRLARAQQRDLRRRAFRLGATIYAEAPSSFAGRIEVYWKRTVKLGPELATGGIAELAREDARSAVARVSSAPSESLERERKFLVTEVPALPADGTVLRQGYLAIDRTVAVRVRDAEAEGRTLTIKAGRGPVRTELEWPISEQQFDAVWEQTGGRRVHKTRYRLPLDHNTIELDVFHDELNGFVLAEVEFDSDESMAGFEPPPWFGGEVTDDVSYTNASLAMDGLPAPTSG